MSDNTWESYTAEDATAAEVAVPPAAVPLIDAANTDAWQVANATSWAE